MPMRISQMMQVLSSVVLPESIVLLKLGMERALDRVNAVKLVTRTTKMPPGASRLRGVFRARFAGFRSRNSPQFNLVRVRAPPEITQR